MFKLIDAWLDRITMYRLLLYYLIGLLVAAIGLSLTGSVHYSAIAIAGSTLLLVGVSWLTNAIFSYYFRVPASNESSIITALILALLITPSIAFDHIVVLTATAGLAIASKYILVRRNQHIFNPAAIAVVLMAFGPQISASWWVGNSSLLPFVLIGGILTVRKLRNAHMVVTFLVTALASVFVVATFGGTNAVNDLHRALLHSSLFFLAFVMLTEPITAPKRREEQIYFAAIVGALFPPQIHIAGLYSTPELALVIGNVYAYLASPKQSLLPILKEKIMIGKRTADFVFHLDEKLAYEPGQYMDWTLPHNNPDARGNRRSFTIASSPTENTLRIGVRFYQDGSSYKRALWDMDESTAIASARVRGDFTMPDDVSQKLAFIAGGIGVTPFRSMIKYLIDMEQSRDIALLYSERFAEDIAYRDVFDTAAIKGMNIVYTLTDDILPADWTGEKGMVSAEMIRTHIPDYAERLFYVSGPHAMVVATQDILLNLGVPRSNIVTDYFSGYA